MPNWADCEMSVVLPSKNADKFENLFLERDSENNKEKERYFARCFKHYSERETNKHGLTRLFIHFDAAWSLNSCMVDGYPQESEGKCPTLEDVCKEMNVIRLSAYSREPGLEFEEQMLYSSENGFFYDSRDMYCEPCYDFLDEDESLEEGAEM